MEHSIVIIAVNMTVIMTVIMMGSDDQNGDNKD